MPGGQAAAEGEDAEPAHPARVEQPGERAPQVEGVLERGAVAAEVRPASARPCPASRASSAWVVSPSGSSPARAAAARTAARSTVAVRSCRPTWRNGSAPTACAANARSVPVGGARGSWSAAGSSRVVDEDDDAARRGRRVASASQPSSARQTSVTWPSASVTPSAASRSARRGVVGAASCDTKRAGLVHGDEELARGRRPAGRPTTRWTGSASRTSFATTAPVSPPGAAPVDERVARGRAARAARAARRGAPARPRPGDSGSRLRSGEPEVPQPAEQAGGERPGPGAVLRDGERVGPAERSHACSTSRPTPRRRSGAPRAR